MIRIVKENNLQENNEKEYAEWVPLGKYVKAIILFVCILILSLGIIISAFVPKELAFIRIIVGVVSLLIFLMYWNYRGLKITLTSNKLEVAYGIFNHKKIDLKKITSCDITKAYFRTYGGIGIRFGLDGSWAYNTDFGEAVKLTFQYGRPFVFSTKNPQKICNLIHELSN
ncbi:MAG TPA: hypothetical protein VMV43_07965 [Candidatus Nanopelagicaceae bacterium]|nr:hypothetical protein [Candidatus Nanopelagicaceae bacterium]